MNKLTALIPTYNEEANLKDCLESVKWADEILVVDSFSTDHTIPIAKDYNARIIQREYGGHSSQRNWAIPQAKHEWILLIDADERVTPELQERLRRLLSETPDCDAYRIKRINYFFNRRLNHGSWGNDWVVRFFHRDRCRLDECGFHGDITKVERIETIQGGLSHLTYRSMDDYFKKFQMYTTDGAKRLFAKNKRASVFDLAIRPLWRFIHTYFLRAGFLDGIAGLNVALLSAYSVFVKYLKLWYFHTIKPPEE